jgi:uncharacterized protein
VTVEGAAPADPLEALLALQDLDTAIAQLEHRKATLPERGRLGEVRLQLAALARRAADLDAARQELTGRQAALERQIATTQSRRQAIEQRMYAARGTAPRDLQAMDEEIRHLAERQSELEDAELELMVEQEPLDAALAEVVATQSALTSEAEELASAVSSAETVIDEQLRGQVADRTATAASVPPDLRDRYEVLRAHMGGVGAARLVGTRCSGCHLELPSMEVERIRHLPPGTVVTCDQCGRILVPVRAAPAPSPPAAP